jgi:signal transduction histidine kinase
VQEALTNALRHAGAARAHVGIRYGAEAIDLDISNTGRVVADGETGSGGYGLAGMRQRVGLYGGELDAGPRAGGGFAVRARIPTGAGSA